MDVLAAICQAIHDKRPVTIRYHSMSRGKSKRVIVPHPHLEHPEISKMDYGMTDGLIQMRV